MLEQNVAGILYQAPIVVFQEAHGVAVIAIVRLRIVVPLEELYQEQPVIPLIRLIGNVLLDMDWQLLGVGVERNPIGPVHLVAPLFQAPPVGLRKLHPPSIPVLRVALSQVPRVPYRKLPIPSIVAR